jgi:hypothetical protein
MSIKARPWPSPTIFALPVFKLAWKIETVILAPMLKPRQFMRALAALTAGALSGLVSFSTFAAPTAGVLDEKHANVLSVISVQNEVTAAWMRQPEVLGTAVGIDASGNTSLLVYVDQDAAKAADAIRSLPQEVRGVRVQVQLTDKFRSMAKPGGGGGTSHTAKQTPPIQLGTSGGWRYDLANGYCCGGTLGSLVSIGGQPHILSNYHVFEADIVLGGNNRVALTGDPIVQPGLIDINCNAATGQDVATLVKRSSLPGSNVDCSVALVTPGMVRSDGAILEIGTISSQTVAAAINQNVKKSGRTTGLTRSHVSGLNATVSIAYENECAGGSAFTKTFTGQIVIANNGSRFLAGGDSGSLMVEDVTTNPRAVGLLFAGSSSTAIANPIGQVLSFLGATMVGN